MSDMCAILICLVAFIGGNYLAWFFIIRQHRRKPVNIPLPKTEGYLHGKYTVTVTGPQGKLLFWQISNPENRKELPYAWALIEADTASRVAFLWMIYVREDVRRQGYGKDMIGVLKEKFVEIRTHYSRGIVSRPGTKLCMSSGFLLKPSIHKRKPGELVWKRDDECHGVVQSLEE